MNRDNLDDYPLMCWNEINLVIIDLLKKSLIANASVSFNARVNSLNKEMLFPHLEKILWEGEFTLRSDP